MDHESNIIQIRQQLEEGRRITVQSVLKSIGTQELRTYIPQIRRRFGVDIASEWVQVGSKRFKEYFKSVKPIQ